MFILSPNAGGVVHCVAMVMYSCMAFLTETEEVLRDLVFDVVCPCTCTPIVVPSTTCPYVTINCMQ